MGAGEDPGVAEAAGGGDDGFELGGDAEVGDDDGEGYGEEEDGDDANCGEAFYDEGDDGQHEGEGWDGHAEAAGAFAGRGGTWLACLPFLQCGFPEELCVDFCIGLSGQGNVFIAEGVTPFCEVALALLLASRGDDFHSEPPARHEGGDDGECGY